MRRAAGQAAGIAAWLLHRLLQIALAVVVLGAVGVGALAWRLSQGPLELPWLTHRLEAAVNEDQAETPGGQPHLTIGGAELAWEGWRKGVDRPLDLRLTDMVATGADGARIAEVPRVAVSFSLGWLLLGRLSPRAIEIDRAQLTLQRTADGAVTLDTGPETPPVAAAQPPAGQPPAGQPSAGRKTC